MFLFYYFNTQKKCVNFRSLSKFACKKIGTRFDYSTRVVWRSASGGAEAGAWREKEEGADGAGRRVTLDRPVVGGRQGGRRGDRRRVNGDPDSTEKHKDP